MSAGGWEKTFHEMQFAPEVCHQLADAVEQTAAKVFQKMLFGVRDHADSDVMRECLDALGQVWKRSDPMKGAEIFSIFCRYFGISGAGGGCRYHCIAQDVCTAAFWNQGYGGGTGYPCRISGTAGAVWAGVCLPAAEKIYTGYDNWL